MKPKTKVNWVEVYRDFLKREMTVESIAKKHKISRVRVYEMVNKIENGDDIQLYAALEKAWFESLWRFRFQTRSVVVGEDNHRLGKLVRDMLKDGFSKRMIEDLTGTSFARITRSLALLKK